MNTTDTTPRIYVGTYAKYASGSIAGKWLDLEDYADKGDFLAACAELHADESDPEFMFQDFEGFPREFYSESYVPEELFQWLELDEHERELVAAYCQATGETVDSETIDRARDQFAGTADSPADFAEETATETCALPEGIPNWIVIDWEATWNRNLRHDYNETYYNGKHWFFYNN